MQRSGLSCAWSSARRLQCVEMDGMRRALGPDRAAVTRIAVHHSEGTMNPFSDHWRRAMALLATLALAGSTWHPRQASAEVDVDLRAGIYTDVSALALGGGFMSSMGSRWFFNPNLEVAIADGGNLFTVNGDFHYDLPSEGPVSLYFGGGPTLLFADPEGGGDSDTQFGLNLLVGVSGLGAQRPFAQVKGIFADGSEVALMGGIRF